ncbi:MAG: chromosome partitioning protein ParA, partial [Pseudomonadales bacterium]|nr:chromosome partitioning protein ParA [Pseudomonadales bacterium]
MSSSAVTSEAILFFDHRGISKSMLYSDFEAILDGMVGVPEFADKEVRGAYCVVTGQLKVRGLVLFTIDFDEDGMADTTWNVPLRHLVEHAAQGPDMGAGPVRLACRSQCPVAWHQDQLWDPGMKPGANDFIAIRDTIIERGSKMGLELDDDLEV